MENKRLTTKCDSDEYIVGVTTNGGYDEDAVLEKQYEANNKLGKLEDLEEELGCPLEVLEKALNNGIYTNVYSGLCIVSRYKDVLDVSDDYSVYIKDYKKTWFLKKDKSE